MELILKVLWVIIKFIFQAIWFVILCVVGAIAFVLCFIIDLGEWLIVAFPGIAWAFLDKNVFKLLAIGCFGLGIYVFIYYKPHSATRYFKAYKKGIISRGEAIEQISNKMYSPKRDKIPPAYQSKILEKRIQSLKKRVNAETEFMEDLIKYIKTKSRLE